jgi:DMSO/TMAO reductase YedYZ molybdopterin-dependent catalytic subunit
LSRLTTAAVPDGLRSALPSPGGGWRIYTVNPPTPRFDRRTWRLVIDGLVERPVQLSYAQVLALPAVDQTSDFHCVTGWSVEGVQWRGVRMADLLRLVRPTERAGAATFTSAERPYVDSLSISQALASDVLLAYAMQGRPLRREHGAPLRLVVPRMYGYKSVKWIERIRLTARQEIGYWEQRGYDEDAWVGRSSTQG